MGVGGVRGRVQVGGFLGGYSALLGLAGLPGLFGLHEAGLHASLYSGDGGAGKITTFFRFTGHSFDSHFGSL